MLTEVDVLFSKEGKSYEELKRELGDVASPVSVAAAVSLHAWDLGIKKKADSDTE